MAMEFTKELLEKARGADSSEALLALAKENNYEMTAEEAEAYFAQMHKSGELSDEELENVSGGGCRKNGHLVVTINYGCLDHWRCKDDRQPLVQIENGTFRCANYKLTNCNNLEYCRYCYYCHYEKGLWLCYNPNK